MTVHAFSGSMHHSEHLIAQASASAVGQLKHCIESPTSERALLASLIRSEHFSILLHACAQLVAPGHQTLFMTALQLKSRSVRSEYLRSMHKSLCAQFIPNSEVSPSSIEGQCLLALDGIIDWPTAPMRARACFVAAMLVEQSRSKRT